MTWNPLKIVLREAVQCYWYGIKLLLNSALHAFTVLMFFKCSNSVFETDTWSKTDLHSHKIISSVLLLDTYEGAFLVFFEVVSFYGLSIMAASIKNHIILSCPCLG
uniref:Uncharacterized protein n=1 Tax=Rhizophora mucronata TaxID=61149 RepID=A0A2P2N7W6_RHIMU